jgi:hypothetical protein
MQRKSISSKYRKSPAKAGISPDNLNYESFPDPFKPRPRVIDDRKSPSQGRSLLYDITFDELDGGNNQSLSHHHQSMTNQRPLLKSTSDLYMLEGVELTELQERKDDITDIYTSLRHITKQVSQLQNILNGIVWSQEIDYIIKAQSIIRGYIVSLIAY